MLVEEIPFSIPADLPPGDYGVQLVLYDDEGGALPMRTADGREAATPPVVGRLQISAGAAGRSSGAALPGRGRRRREPDLRPVGSWESPEKLMAGVPADLHVSWQALRPLETCDLRFRLRATAEDGSVLWEQPADPVTPLPERWPAGQTYRLTHRLQPEAPRARGGERFARALRRAERTRRWPARWSADPRSSAGSPAFELPAAPQQTADARWDDALTLAGYDLERAGQA